MSNPLTKIRSILSDENKRTNVIAVFAAAYGVAKIFGYSQLSIEQEGALACFLLALLASVIGW